MLFRRVPVGLGLLRRIDPGEPHAVLDAIGLEDRDRVPIGDPNYATDQLVAR